MEVTSDLLAFRLLKWFCPGHLHEEIEGDLIQQFQRDTKIHGIQRAKRRLLWSSMRFFRPGIVLRNKFSTEPPVVPMIRSYFIILFRNLARRKFYSSLNILCLTVGIAFALLIGMFIQGELKVNKDLKDVDRLYLLQSKYSTDRGNFEWFVPGQLAKAAKEQYPGTFENYYRFLDRNITISKEDKHFRIQSMIGDPSFIDMFGFKVLHGDTKGSLVHPNSIVITDKIAIQYFSKTDVVGETLSVKTEQSGIKEFAITAVIAQPEEKNSVSDFMNMNAQVFLPMENVRDFLAQANPDAWWADAISYIKLSPQAEAAKAEGILNEILQKNAPPPVIENRTVSLNSLKDYYLITNHGAVKKLIASLSVIVIFILALAVSNFINIAVASSISRLKETGIRKAIGGVKNQIVFQFLLEAMTFTIFAGVLALGCYEVLHSYFGKVLDAPLPSILHFDLVTWKWFVVGILVIGVLAGLYPAIYQSTAKSIDSLKGKFKSVKGSVQFSRGLVATQFIITLFIFIAAIVLSKQVSYFLEKDLGFNKSHVLVVTSVPRVFNDEGFQQMASAKQAFLTSSKIKDVSLSWGAPGWNFSPFDLQVYHSENADKNDSVRSTITAADEDYLKVFDIKLAEGDFVNGDHLNQIVINRTARKSLSVKVGDKVKFQGDNVNEFTVSGIVDDFNFESLHEPVKPVVFMHTKAMQMYRYFSFKLEPGSLAASVSEVERLWKQVFPNDPFDYTFADERLQSLYTTELQLKKSSSIATVLMFIIVLTGVLGLVSLNVSKRIKEIGIRKVLGASVSDILVLLSCEYATSILIASVIAIPSSWYFGENWLANFAYRIDLKWWMFFIPLACLFAGTIMIVCIQSMKTALSNPVKSLRYE